MRTLDASRFRLPEDLPAYRDALREFLRTEGQDLSEEVEETGRLPDRLWPLFRQAGLFRLTLPREVGGYGLTPTQYAPLLEEVARLHGAIRLLVHMWNWVSSALLARVGTPDQKRAYLEPMARGEGLIAFALTEPEAGTGRDIRCQARRDGDLFRLRGHKHLISYADIARAFQVVAYTDPSKGADGISLFLVDRDAPGFTVAPMPDGMGMRGSFHGVLRFEDTPVPATHLLGPEGQGLHLALDMLDVSRTLIAISCVGLAQEMLERSARYAWHRVTFGKPIAERQAIQGLIAEMATRISAGRALAMAVLQKAEAGEPIRALAAQAKLFAVEMVRRVSDWALEVHGGIGYLKGLPIERMYRDARALWFEEGSPTIQRMVIARDVLARAREG